MLRDWSDRATSRARRVPPVLQYVIGGVLALFLAFVVMLPFM